MIANTTVGWGYRVSMEVPCLRVFVGVCGQPATASGLTFCWLIEQPLCDARVATVVVGPAFSTLRE